MVKEVETNSLGQETAEVEFFNVTTESGLDDTAAAEQGEEYHASGTTAAKEVISEEMAGSILKTPFAVAAAYWGDYWNLSPEEVAIMAPPAARLFTEWFGQWVEKCPDAYMLGFSLIMATVPRAMQTIQEVKARRAAEPDPVKEETAEDGGREEYF